MPMKSTSGMVDRFLTWRLPLDVCPDGAPGDPLRTGTNLLTARQAEQMLQYVMDGADILAPHQRRVVDEKAELDERLDKLCLFSNSNTFASLPIAEQERMNTQRHLMCSLSAVLGARIAAFNSSQL